MRKKKQKERRAKGAGSVFERGNKWYGRLRKQGSELLTEPYATAAEAEAALSRLVGGEVDPRFLPTLQSYWSRLLAPGGVWEDRYDKGTCNLYDTVLAGHVHGTELGKMRLDHIRQHHVQRRVDKISKLCAASTTRRYGSCISQVLEQAVAERLLRARLEGGEVFPANPALGVRYPVIPDSTDVHIHTEAELVNIPELLYEQNPRLSAMYTVLADTGVRPGELCGMDAQDIDSKGVWTIHQMRRHDGTIKDQTKNGVVRRIQLSEDALAAIEECGQRRGAVWLNEDGNPVRPDALWTHLYRFQKSLQAKLEKEAKKLGAAAPIVPSLRPRDLRKTFVTRGLEMSDLKTVQQAAGHKRASTTSDVYAKARKGTSSELVGMLEKGTKRGLFDRRGANRGAEAVTDSQVESA